MIQKLQENSHVAACPLAALEQKIASREALVGVVGLGYVGMPLVRAFVGGGFRALGFDVSDKELRRIKEENAKD